MALSQTPAGRDEHAARASAHPKRDAALTSLVGGLSAWLGGVAFCIGFGVTAPAWVALVVTVLSVAAAKLADRVLRRPARAAG